MLLNNRKRKTKWIQKIREIVEIFENSQISRMDVEQDLFKIRLEKKEVITVSNAVVTEKKKEEPEKEMYIC